MSKETTNQELERMREDFIAAIDFAIHADDPKSFLSAWRDGDWVTIRNEWPDFNLPPMADET